MGEDAVDDAEILEHLEGARLDALAARSGLRAGGGLDQAEGDAAAGELAAEAPGPVRRRRHGEELESALLVAGWDELVAVGYARLTMESVALRARTGIAVLYRRWANKAGLVLAAIEHHRNAHPVDVPNTGALRSDLIVQLTALSDALAGYFAIAAAAVFSGLAADTGRTPSQLREEIMNAQQLPRLSTSAPTNAATSTSTPSPHPCSPCRSIWCPTTC